MNPTLVTGDDTTLVVQLKKDSASFTIANTAIVRATIIDKRGNRILSGITTCLHTAPGAVWSSSKIIVNFTSTNTASIVEYGDAKLEIEVQDGSTLTWFSNITIAKGNIQ